MQHRPEREGRPDTEWRSGWRRVSTHVEETLHRWYGDMRVWTWYGDMSIDTEYRHMLWRHGPSQLAPTRATLLRERPTPCPAATGWQEQLTLDRTSAHKSHLALYTAQESAFHSMCRVTLLSLDHTRMTLHKSHAQESRTRVTHTSHAGGVRQTTHCRHSFILTSPMTPRAQPNKRPAVRRFDRLCSSSSR